MLGLPTRDFGATPLPQGAYIVTFFDGDDLLFEERPRVHFADATDAYLDHRNDGDDASVFRIEGTMLVDVTDDADARLRAQFWHDEHPPAWLFPEVEAKRQWSGYQAELRDADRFAAE